MAEKKYHKGWLYERDGVKFSPYTLKEGIIDRNGAKWAESVDSSISAANEAIITLAGTTIPNLEGQIAGAHDRATLLEQRTQYMDATASEVFYVVDGNGNIALQVDGNGATSFNFITPETDLNSLAIRTSAAEESIAALAGDSIPNLVSDIEELQLRTKYMNAGIDSAAFYVVDGNGNIAAVIDGTGITSFDFISKDVTSLNALYVDFQNHGIMINTINEAIDDIANNRIPALSSDIEALQARTKYLDASNDDDNTFYVIDKNGNIAMKVDINGVTSFNFTSQDVGDLNSLIGEVDNTITRVGVLEETIPALKNETDDIIQQIINNIEGKSEEWDWNTNPRIVDLENRTKYLNASEDWDTFYIVDQNGNIGMKVNKDGVTSFEFIVGDMKIKSTIDEIIQKNSQQDEAITQLNTKITTDINSAKTELTTLINNTKTELTTNINKVNTDLSKTITDLNTELSAEDERIKENITTLNNKVESNKIELNQNITNVNNSLIETISGLKNELDKTDENLANDLSDLTDRTANLETRTKYLDASENYYFAITDSAGNIGMKVDGNGVVAYNFYLQTKDQNNNNPQIPLIGYEIVSTISI